jgi:phosphopantothenoylcysteine decarboxylase/phosphopantothenate--cysteine ligase
MPTLLLGVTGGIAAYKSVEVASRLRKLGWDVHVIMTEAATRFVAPLTFQGVSRHPVHVDQWSQGNDSGIEHIDVARGVDVFLVAPATAHTLARLAHGLADDLLTMTALAVRAPLLLAPAMNPHMLNHPATRANLALLEGRGARVVPAGNGEMACGDIGQGRLAEVDDIVAAVIALYAQQRDMVGKSVLVTAGGTREPLDPVRFLGNRSSGRMGHAIADAARARGATVTLVTTAPTLAPSGVELIAVDTALEMHDAVLELFDRQDIVVMSAAVADYRPAEQYAGKRKKTDVPWTVTFVPNPDILAELGRRKRHQLLIGFAAETGDPLVAAAEKLKRKNADLIVANDVSVVGQGFEVENNRVQIVGPEGLVADWPLMSKREIGDRLWDLVASRPPCGIVR